MRFPTNDSTLFWIVAPVVFSLGLLLGGVSLRSRPAGKALIMIGATALLISVGWFLLVLRIEDIERRNLDQGTPATVRRDTA